MTQEELKKRLAYEKNTGLFKWRYTKGRCKEGKIAGCLSKGYIIIGLNGKNFQAHRLAWLYEHGEFPKGIIDHINRIKNDNTITNLRDTNFFVNNSNIGIQKSNNSGVTGVSFQKNRKTWQAQIRINGVRKHLGNFKSKEAAIDARQSAERKS